MDSCEKAAMQNLFIVLRDDLNDKWIQDILYEKEIIEMADIQSNDPSIEKVSKILISCTKKCTRSDFFYTLFECDQQHLVDLLKEKVLYYRKLRPSQIRFEKLDEKKFFSKNSIVLLIFFKLTFICQLKMFV